jgi:hypothetical protein
MAIEVKELRQWLKGFSEHQTVSIDEGGLILQETGDRSHYLEIGGDPTESEDPSGLCPVCGEEIDLKGTTKDGRLIGTCGDAFTLAKWNE